MASRARKPARAKSTGASSPAAPDATARSLELPVLASAPLKKAVG